jgi:hypothetical protein
MSRIKQEIRGHFSDYFEFPTMVQRIGRYLKHRAKRLSLIRTLKDLDIPIDEKEVNPESKHEEDVKIAHIGKGRDLLNVKKEHTKLHDYLKNHFPNEFRKHINGQRIVTFLPGDPIALEHLKKLGIDLSNDDYEGYIKNPNHHIGGINVWEHKLVHAPIKNGLVSFPTILHELGHTISDALVTHPNYNKMHNKIYEEYKKQPEKYQYYDNGSGIRYFPEEVSSEVIADTIKDALNEYKNQPIKSLSNAISRALVNIPRFELRVALQDYFNQLRKKV